MCTVNCITLALKSVPSVFKRQTWLAILNPGHAIIDKKIEVTYISESQINPSSAGIDFRHQNMTSIGVK